MGVTGRDLSTLQRGLEVVAYVCREGDVGFNAIAAYLDLAPTIVSRLLKDLSAQDWIARHPESGRYRPGFRLAEMQVGGPTPERARILAEPMLRELSEQTQNTVMLIWKEGWMPIAKVTHEDSMAMRAVDLPFANATRYPWGWWFLAESDPAVRKQQMQLEGDPSWRTKAKRGMAQTVGARFVEMRMPGNRRLAAPIRTGSGTLIACIGLGASDRSMTDRSAELYGTMIAAAADRLGRLLGRVG